MVSILSPSTIVRQLSGGFVYNQQVTDFSTAPPEPLAPVLVSIADRQPQSRGTVLIRLILAIPHLIVLWALSIAVVVVGFIGWWAALFTGQLPTWAADFLAGVVHWQARVYAYLYLLTDKYPPFTLGDAYYPVRIALRPGKLNRLAVLFRVILMIPAWIVQTVLVYGTLNIVAFVTWLIALITGTIPEPLHQALAATLRFLIRCTGYQLMLTSAYPSGLFGDRPAEFASTAYAPAGTAYTPAGTAFTPAETTFAPAEPTEDAFTTAPDAPEPSADAFTTAEPAADAFTVDEPAADAFTAAGPAGGAFAAPGPAGDAFSAAGPGGAGFAGAEPGLGAWSLILTSAARRLIVVFLVLGVIVLAGTTSVRIITGEGAVSKAVALSDVEAAYTTLGQAVTKADTSLQACGNSVSCVAKVDGSLAPVFRNFGASVAAIHMPAGTPSTSAQAVAADAQAGADDLTQLSKATSVSQYTSLEKSTGAEAHLDKLSKDYGTLITSLGGSVSSS
jgi:uncharacterized protein DUF4389